MQEREGVYTPEGLRTSGVPLDPVVFQIFFDVRYPNRRSGQVCLTAHTASLPLSISGCLERVFVSDV